MPGWTRFRFWPWALALMLLAAWKPLEAAVPAPIESYIVSRIAAFQSGLLGAALAPADEAMAQRVIFAQGFHSEIFQVFPAFPRTATHVLELAACVRRVIAENRLGIAWDGVPAPSPYPDDALLLAPAFDPGHPKAAQLKALTELVDGAARARGRGLLPMDEEFWMNDYALHLHTDEARAPFRTQVRNGRLCQNGVPMARGRYNFVLAPDLELFVGPMEVKNMRHSSFLAGGALIAAGELELDQGQVLRVTHQSGHYLPGAQTLIRMLRVLLHQGIDLAGVRVVLAGETQDLAAMAFLQSGDADRRTLLTEVLPAGDVGSLRAFLDGQPLPVAVPMVMPNGSQVSLLHLACLFGLGPDALRLLVERGAEVNRPDSLGQTAVGLLLHRAPVPRPQLEVLLAAGADLGMPWGWARQDLMLEVLLSGDRDLYRFLAGRSVHRIAPEAINESPSGGQPNALMRYLDQRRTDPWVVAELLRLGGNPSLPSHPGGPTPLHLAALHQDLPALKLLLAVPGGDPNTLGGLPPRTPLDWAILGEAASAGPEGKAAEPSEVQRYLLSLKGRRSEPLL